MKNYIQIGTNKGNDSFKTIISDLEEKSQVILIEPNINLIQKIEYDYLSLIQKHDVIILQKAITTENKKVELYFWGPDEHSSLIKRKSILIDPKEIMEVEGINFNFLCDKMNIIDIECLQIDTEGMDYEIINSIDLQKLNIKQIIFEKWSFDDDDLNEQYKTGPSFLDNILKPKLINYNWSEIKNDSMYNFVLTKKN